MDAMKTCGIEYSKSKEIAKALLRKGICGEVKAEIKPGIDKVFESNKELANIGTEEQYAEYLDTIFPDSKVRYIVYHTSPNKIEKFRDSMFGTYFSYSPIKGVYGDIVHYVLLDVKSPLTIPSVNDNSEVKEAYNKDNRAYNNQTSFTSNGIPIYKYDASIESSSVTKEGIQIKVRNPEQIYILGSQQDIQ
jgi:hypothetical protein